MIDPIFWLVLSFLLVSVSLTAVLVVLVPAVRELSRAAHSVEKLCDTLNRELPPTLESIRLTSTEITQLTDEVNGSVQSAHRVAQQVDHGVIHAKAQAKQATIGTRSFLAGVNAAWMTLTQSPSSQASSRTAKPSTVPSRPEPSMPTTGSSIPRARADESASLPPRDELSSPSSMGVDNRSDPARSPSSDSPSG